MIRNLKELSELRLYPIPTGRFKSNLNMVRVSGSTVLGVDRKGKLYSSVVTDRKGERFRNLRHWARGDMLETLVKLGFASPELKAELDKARDEEDRYSKLNRWRENADVLREFDLDPSMSMMDFMKEVDRILHERRNRPS